MSPRRRGRGRGVDGPAVAAAPGTTGAPYAEATEQGATDSALVTQPDPRTTAGPDPVTGVQGLSGGANSMPPRRQPRPGPDAPAPAHVEGEEPAPGQKASCTLAQMRRFIKSRPYVPVHELRRRFLIEGLEDEVSPMPTGQRTLFVGLPEREAGFLGELVKGGEVGCELLLDPTSPAVVGVFPMRPVARQ